VKKGNEMADALVYARPAEGAWVRPIEDGFKMECCDCCLVHTIDFRIVASRWLARLLRFAVFFGMEPMIEFRAYRDDPATEEKRDVKFPRAA